MNTIAGTKAGAEVLTGLIEAGGSVTFEYAKGTLATAGEWFGNDSTIYFDPNHATKVVTSGNLYRTANPDMILAHELYHAWNNAASSWFSGEGARRIGSAVYGASSTRGIRNKTH